MGLLLRVLPYVRPYSRLAILSVAATIASVGLGLLLPWPLKIVVDSVLGSRPLPAFLIDRFGGVDRLTMLTIAVLAGLTFTLLVNALAVAMRRLPRSGARSPDGRTYAWCSSPSTRPRIRRDTPNSGSSPPVRRSISTMAIGPRRTSAT